MASSFKQGFIDGMTFKRNLDGTSLFNLENLAGGLAHAGIGWGIGKLILMKGLKRKAPILTSMFRESIGAGKLKGN